MSSSHKKIGFVFCATEVEEDNSRGKMTTGRARTGMTRTGTTKIVRRKTARRRSTGSRAMGKRMIRRRTIRRTRRTMRVEGVGRGVMTARKMIRRI